jgi:hypothetical protein
VEPSRGHQVFRGTVPGVTGRRTDVGKCLHVHPVSLGAIALGLSESVATVAA